jgi:hypothetical protein
LKFLISGIGFIVHKIIRLPKEALSNLNEIKELKVLCLNNLCTGLQLCVFGYKGTAVIAKHMRVLQGMRANDIPISNFSSARVMHTLQVQGVTHKGSW